MAATSITRRLAAIFVVDAVGYSRLMGVDEMGTHTQFKSDVATYFHPLIDSHNGRLVKTTGDGLIAEFSSVVDAVECAAAVQDAIDEQDGGSGRLLNYRIGINLGDILVDEGDIYGDDVNIAVRLEHLADPGGITLSRAAYRSVKGKLNLAFEDMGEHDFKNIVEPVRVYRVVRSPRAAEAAQAEDSTTEPTVRVPAGRQDAEETPAIVVLPFENLGGDPDQEHLCDGLTNDITTDLSKFRNLFVIAANSAFAYKGKRVKPQEVGRELGVRYLLEGSVQRAGERVRINVQLIDTATGLHLWAERFGRAFEDLFALQDEIIQKIVVALAFKVEAVERDRVLRKDPVDMNAYQTYLKGIHLFSFETEEDLGQCRAMFQRAAELDPRFARAWGFMAYCDVRAVLSGWKDSETLVGAEEFAKRAVGLDSSDYANHWDLAYVYLNSGRFDQALSEYRRAILLNPNDADLLAEMAEMLVYTGQSREAIAQIEQAMAINPHFPDWYHWNLGWAAYNAQDYDGALEQLNQMADPPNDVRLFVAAAHAQKGDTGAAEGALQTFLNERASPYTIADVRRRGRFKHRRDEEHWLDGLRKAGLPD